MAFTDRLNRIVPALAVLVALSTYAQDDVVTREDAKRSLTHAMLQNTTWKNELAIDVFVVGLYGRDKELEEVLGEYMPTIEVRGKPVVVKTYQSLAAAREANILLLARSENDRLDEINEGLRQSQTLVVTDGFDDKTKIMANFSHPARRRVTFDINASNIIDAGLELSGDILMFAGSKQDFADFYQYNEVKLARARAAELELQQQLDEQRQRLDEQQLRLDGQQKLLSERDELLDQSVAVDKLRAQLEANQSELASLKDQLASAQQTVSENQSQIDQYAVDLKTKDALLAEKAAELENYSREVALSQEQLRAEQQPASPPGSAPPVQRPVTENQPGFIENRRFILVTAAGVILLVLMLIGLIFHAHRSKRRLAKQLEGQALKLGVANDRLVEMTDAKSRSVLEQSKLLAGTGLSNQQNEYVSLISNSADDLLSLSNDITELANVEAGRLELEATSFSLRDVLGDILQPLALRAGKKGLELTFHIPPSIPDSLIGDPGRLRQIMDKLVGNAIKYTESGEVSVDLQLESASEDAVQVRFEVRDTGAGIAPEQHKTVFEPFVREDISTLRDDRGAGLGLTISDQLAQLMGSRLSVSSEPGAGSSFYFSADFKLPDGPVPAAVKPLRALVVDDNETTLMILEELLDSWGMAVTTAHGGESALEELARSEQTGDNFTLALLDVVMPGMNGFELAARIRERPAQQAVRILMLTSAGQTDTADLQEQLDISTVLLKPTKHSELLGAITEALGIRAEAVARHEQDAAVKPNSVKVTPMKSIDAKRKVAAEMLGKSSPAIEVANSESKAIDYVPTQVQYDDKKTGQVETISPGDNNQPCLDWDGALRNLEGDEDFLRELARNFLVQYPKMLLGIEEAVSKGEGDELRHTAHMLKGEAQLIGAIVVTESALRLESLGHMDEVSGAMEALRDLQDNLAELKTALVSELAEREAPDELTQTNQV